MKQEEWRTIEGYGGRYEVSNLGRVRTNRFTSPVVLRGYTNIDSYPSVNLSPRISGKTRFIHRMVAEAFLPNPKGLPCVNHKDGDRGNAALSNLEWVTASENTLHGYMSGRITSPFKKYFGEKAFSAKLKETQVLQIRTSYTGKRGEVTRLSKMYGVSDHAIRDILSRHSWKHI